MKTVWMWLQGALTMAGGWIGWFLGGLDGLVYALLAFIAIDYITGCLCAIIEKKLSSAIGLRGIVKKVVILLLVGLANVIDMYLIGAGNAIRTAVIFFFLSNEGVSVLENASRLGLPVPPKLKTALACLHNNSKKKDT